MYARGKGRGVLGSWSPQNDLHSRSQNFRVQPVVVTNPYRIVSLSSPPSRPPVTSRLGWIPENTSPQQNATGLSPGSQLPQRAGQCLGKPKPRTPCKNTLDSSSSPLSSEPLLSKAQSKTSSIKLISTLELGNKKKQWENKSGNEYGNVNDAVHDPCVQVVTHIHEDFTNDDGMDCFSDAPPTTKSADQKTSFLDLSVLHLLESIEEGARRPNENGEKQRDLEEGECEEPQDFPSRMVKYYRDVEAANTFVPVSATSDSSNANQESVKMPSPEDPESVQSLKQALEEIRRRKAESINQMSNQAAGQVVEEQKIIRIATPLSDMSIKEAQGRSSRESSNSSIAKRPQKLNGRRDSEDRKSTGSNQARNFSRAEDTEWRREVRIVERRERSRDPHPSREREIRRVDRSASRNRSRSPRRRHIRRSPPTRLRSRSRSLVRRRSRSRSPLYRRGRSRSRSPPRFQRRHRSRSGRRGSRSPIHRAPRSPIRRAPASPYRRGSRDRSPFDRILFERNALSRRSRTPGRPISKSTRSRSPTPCKSIREELVAIHNGTAPNSTPTVSQHIVQTTSPITSVPSDVTQGYTGHTVPAAAHVSTSYSSALPQEPLPAHPPPPHMMNLTGYYGQQSIASSAGQEQFAMQQISPHQLLHQQAIMRHPHPQLLLHHQMIQRQQFQEHLQQQFFEYHRAAQQQHQPQQQPPHPLQQAEPECYAMPPAASLENASETRNEASQQSSAVAAQKDELAALEQRLRAQRDSKLEKQLNLIHQLLIVRFQQADSEQKQKIATTEVERERLSLNIMEKAKLEKEMASSAQALEKFIQRATLQLGENLDEVKKEQSNHLYRFYDPQQHWCELCDVVCEKLHDYLNHLHSKEHEQRLESTGVPSMPWHNRQKATEKEDTTGKDGLIANRIPFGGLQSLQPVKAWYCEMCDVWMGDIHCAQLHMSSTQHNNSFLKRIMERPESGFLYAVKKQAALKKNLARSKEEDKGRVSTEPANRRKMEEILEARKKKRIEDFEMKKKQMDENQKKLREANQDAAPERGDDELSKELPIANGFNGACASIKLCTENSLPSSDLIVAADAYQAGPKSGTPFVENSQAQPEQMKPIAVNQAGKDNEAEEANRHGVSQECEAPDARKNEDEDCVLKSAPISEVASCEGCEEMPLDGLETESDLSSKSNSSRGGAETKEIPNIQSDLVHDSRGEHLNAEVEGFSVAESTTNSRTEDRQECQDGETSAQFAPCVILPRKEGQHLLSGSNSANGEVDKNMHASCAIESQKDVSGLRPHEDRSISPVHSGETDDSAESIGPISRSSLRSGAPENQETWHSMTSLQPLSGISVKIEPEELRPVKTEKDLSANVEEPVVLVKSERFPSSIQVESSLVGSSGQPPERSNVVLKKESEIKKETASLGDYEDVERQTERRYSSSSGEDDANKQLDDSDTNDCCIIGEVDSRSGKVFDLVDLESNLLAPTRKAKQDSDANGLVFDQPYDAPDSEVCVQLSDFIVLSETGEQDSAEADD